MSKLNAIKEQVEELLDKEKKILSEIEYSYPYDVDLGRATKFKIEAYKEVLSIIHKESI